MAFPAAFVFSQSSLKDYRDCPRRFQLRYLQRLAWPAPQSADALDLERRIRLGDAFHALVRRHQAGVPEEALTPLAEADRDLSRRWRAYLGSPYARIAAPVRRAELALAAPLAGYRLEAQYDLVAGTPGGDWLIVDWKTGADATPRARLEDHPQTVVYRYLLAQAGAALNGGTPIAPERITMTYWFAAGHRPPESFSYDAARHASDSATLSAWVLDIASRADAEWPATDDERRCAFCAYRSYCRPTLALPGLAELEAAGELAEALPVSLDLIEEIAF
ncbi:MAG: PD-(D/E)XK nuclease family protein [Anaerolineae bacterium]